MIETREIDPQDHRAMFRQIQEDRRAGRISANYPAWFHLMARLLGREIRGDQHESAIIYGCERLRVVVKLAAREYGWEAIVNGQAPKGLLYPLPTPPMMSARYDARQDAFAVQWEAWKSVMMLRHGELEAFSKWRKAEQVCREIYGECEAVLGERESEDPGILCFESSINWRRGRG